MKTLMCRQIAQGNKPPTGNTKSQCHRTEKKKKTLTLANMSVSAQF